MTISPSRHFLVVAATFHLCVLTFAVDKENERFSGDFQNFLKDMESIVFKEKEGKDLTKKTAHPTTKNPNLKKNTNILRTQKAAIRDVLMMKLVSYYEDKYKLASHEVSPPTNQRATKRPPTKPPPKMGIRKALTQVSDRVTLAGDVNDIDDDPDGSSEVVVL